MFPEPIPESCHSIAPALAPLTVVVTVLTRLQGPLVPPPADWYTLQYRTVPALRTCIFAPIPWTVASDETV